MSILFESAATLFISEEARKKYLAEQIVGGPGVREML
jgi:hypothetical protein